VDKIKQMKSNDDGEIRRDLIPKEKTEFDWKQQRDDAIALRTYKEDGSSISSFRNEEMYIVKKIPISDMHFKQDFVERDKLISMLKATEKGTFNPSKDDLPKVMLTRAGEYVLTDGTHRAVLNMLLGNKEMECKFVDANNFLSSKDNKTVDARGWFANNPNNPHVPKKSKESTGRTITPKQAAKYEQQRQKLKDEKYADGTYDLDNLQTVKYTTGYQVTFCQIGDDNSDSVWLAGMMNEFVDKSSDGRVCYSSDGKVLGGKFQSEPEFSFNVSSKEDAIVLGKKFNQISILDWEALERKDYDNMFISTGGTGRRA